MDWERLPVAPLYADVRAYCSHVKTYCKRARLLSSHPRLFILSLFDLAHHIFGETFRTFELSILSVNRGKLDIRYLVGPYVALHSTSTNPCALWQIRIPKNVVQPNSIQQWLTRGNSKHIIFIQYIDFLVSDCHSGFVLVSSASFLQLFLFTM